VKRAIIVALLLSGTVWAQQSVKDAPPKPEWIPDPSAGHYDCPAGWMAYQKAEPPVLWDGPVAASASSTSAVYITPPKDKKGHLIGAQPPPPICIKEPAI
jgi:hypothetical protein